MVKRLGPSRCGARDTTLPGATPDRRGPGRATERTHHVIAPRCARAVARRVLAVVGTRRRAVRPGGDRAARSAWTANSWPGGFTADVRVTPGEAVHGWTLTWAFPSGQTVTQGWNATVVQNGAERHGDQRSVERRHPGGWQHVVRLPGHLHGHPTPCPPTFALNGVACNGAAPSTDGAASRPPSRSRPTGRRCRSPTPDRHAHSDPHADADAHRPDQPRLRHRPLLRRPRVPDRHDAASPWTVTSPRLLGHRHRLGRQHGRALGHPLAQDRRHRRLLQPRVRAGRRRPVDGCRSRTTCASTSGTPPCSRPRTPRSSR